jgi:hypothetical protein
LGAENGYSEVVKALLGTGQVDINERDCDSRTPLSWALIGLVSVMLHMSLRETLQVSEK